MAEIDFVKESKVLLDFIEKLKRGEPIMQAATAAPQQTGYAAAAPRVNPQPFLKGIVTVVKADVLNSCHTHL